MSGKSGSQSKSAFSEQEIKDLKNRALRYHLIIGGALPTTAELMTGLPFCRDDIAADVMAYIDDWKACSDGNLDPDLEAAAEIARANPTIQVLSRLHELSVDEEKGRYIDADLAERCDLWIAYFGDEKARSRVIYRAVKSLRMNQPDIDAFYRLVLACGLPWHKESGKYSAGGTDRIVYNGLSALSDFSTATENLADGTVAAGLLAILKRKHVDDETDGITLDEIFRSVDEKEIQPSADNMPANTAGLVVVQTLPKGGTAVQKEIRFGWSSLAGKPLPLVSRGDVARHRTELVARWPHAADIIDVILSDLAALETVRFRPTLLVGSSGSGKSSLARAIFEQVGIPCELSSMAGVSDSAMMGTSAQWSTARESQPLQLIKRSSMASVGMIWDEIEKAGAGRHNGSALDALLPMLEVDQARKYRDLALEVDLSAVSHFATANTLDGIPAPLRDRMRILAMPEPTWAHLGTLTRQIIDRIAGERGIDARFFGSLAEDEMDLVRQAWPGGSIRKLTTIIRTICDGRDHFGRC